MMMNFSQKDEQLFIAVSDVRQGNTTYSQFMYDTTYPYVYKMIYDLLHNIDVCNTLTYSVIEKIYAEIRSLQDVRLYYSYISRITSEKVLEYVKSTKPDFMILQSTQEMPLPFERAQEDTECFVDEGILTNHEKLRIIEEKMISMPIEQRLCLQFFYNDGLSIEEIAFKLSCTSEAVKQQLALARQALKDTIFLFPDHGQTRLYSLAGVPFLLILMKTGVERYLATGLISAGVATAAGAISGAAIEGSMVATGGGIAGAGVGTVAGAGVGSGSGAVGVGTAAGTAGVGSAAGAAGVGAAAGAAGLGSAAGAASAGAAVAVAGTTGTAIGVKIAVAAIVTTVAVGGMVKEAVTYHKEVREEISYLKDHPEDYLHDVKAESNLEDKKETAKKSDYEYENVAEALLYLGASEKSIEEYMESMGNKEFSEIYDQLEAICDAYFDALNTIESSMEKEQYEIFAKCALDDWEISLVAVFDCVEEYRGLTMLYGATDEDLEEYLSVVQGFIEESKDRYDAYTTVFGNAATKNVLKQIPTAEIQNAYGMGENLLYIVHQYAVSETDEYINELVALDTLDTNYYISYLALQGYAAGGTDDFVNKLDTYKAQMKPGSYYEEIR